MIPVLLASPYAGDVERHVAYALACVRDSIARGELARRLVVYVDLGISRGMAEEMAHAWGDQWLVEERRIGGAW